MNNDNVFDIIIDILDPTMLFGKFRIQAIGRCTVTH